MSSGTSGSDEKISGSKIDPLASDTKANVPLDMSSRGAIGSDRNIDQARIEPIGGRGVSLLPLSASGLDADVSCRADTKAGQYQHPAPHADSGVIGSDVNIDKAKIEPLQEQGGAGKGHAKSAGLGDEEVDAARVQPLGAVREQMS